MRKFLVISLPIVTIALFILVMLSGNILKKPLGNEDNIPNFIEQLIENVNQENWEAANQNLENLSRVWEKVVKRVQYSSERNEINNFSTSLARLRGALQAEDKSSGLQELHEAYEHWKDLGK